MCEVAYKCGRTEALWSDRHAEVEEPMKTLQVSLSAPLPQGPLLERSRSLWPEQGRTGAGQDRGRAGQGQGSVGSGWLSHL